MELVYIGGHPGMGAIPLPQGWPAANHDEPDADVAAEKVATGMYRYARPPRTKIPPASSAEEE